MVIHHQNARARENFPVASRLLPAGLRAPVLALYDFARGADDIADSPTLPPEEKCEQLAALRTALQEGDKEKAPHWAQAYIVESRAAPVLVRHAEDLLHAFTQDATQQHYPDWASLWDYCNHSAAPIGRAMLDLAEEAQADRTASDALCNALQLLNHLQDCGEDYRALGRVYLPQDWLAEAGARPEMLQETRCTQALRTVIDTMLDATDEAIGRAQGLPAQLRSTRLRVEIALIWHIARRLSARLRKQDPLAQHVRLSAADYTACLCRAITAL